jgi:mRNA-degrading endonuclease RelE of RelBE toxin-antitoxin system
VARSDGVVIGAGIPYNPRMRTIIETPTFQKQAEKIWSQSEREAFIDWIAVNPDAGDVIPGAGGARKVRWAVAGRGKRGGARVIYFNLTQKEIVLLVAVYDKTSQENILPNEIEKEH